MRGDVVGIVIPVGLGADQAKGFQQRFLGLVDPVCRRWEYCRYLQLPFVGVSWGVGIRLAYQLDIFPIEEPVAIEAFNGDFWLICREEEGWKRRGWR